MIWLGKPKAEPKKEPKSIFYIVDKPRKRPATSKVVFIGRRGPFGEKIRNEHIPTR